MFRRLRRELGVRSYLAHNMTVTPANLDQVAEVVARCCAMGYQMMSFQPAAFLGDDRRWREGYRERDRRRGVGADRAGRRGPAALPGIQFGDPRCNRTAFGLLVGRRWVPLVDERRRRATSSPVTRFYAHFGGVGFAGDPAAAAASAGAGSGVLAAHPGRRRRSAALRPRPLRRRCGRRRLCAALRRAGAADDVRGAHAFMDAADVAPAWELRERGERSNDPAVRATQERLQACIYAMAHPETGRLVPACAQHAVLDPVENAELRRLLPDAPGASRFRGPTVTATVPRPPRGGAWDLLVVGGGSAGLVGARTAAFFGASVLLVERARPGGDCLWSGCVPSKALLAAAGAAAHARRAGRFGVHTAPVRVEFSEVMAHVRASMAQIEPVDSPEAVRAAGAAYAAATARFTGPDTADVGGVAVRFRSALIATGSSPAVPAIPGLDRPGDAPRVLTSDTVWDLTELPGRLVVLGGGTIGCELGLASARLGSRVTVVEAGPRLLPAEDPDASAAVAAALVDDGAVVLTGTAVTAVEHRRRRLPGAGAARRRTAAGRGRGARRRRPAPGRPGLGLDAAGVGVDDAGAVSVDDHLRTTSSRIWAAGDVTAHPRFTHVAGTHGSLAATNAVLGLRRRVDPVVPRVTFTDPEVAAVGR